MDLSASSGCTSICATCEPAAYAAAAGANQMNTRKLEGLGSGGPRILGDAHRECGPSALPGWMLRRAQPLALPKHKGPAYRHCRGPGVTGPVRLMCMPSPLTPLPFLAECSVVGQRNSKCAHRRVPGCPGTAPQFTIRVLWSVTTRLLSLEGRDWHTVPVPPAYQGAASKL